MDPTLKEAEYDAILVGTGMVEAILAGYVSYHRTASLFTMGIVASTMRYGAVDTDADADVNGRGALYVVRWLVLGRKCCISTRYARAIIVANDYYGSNYTSFPLKQFLAWTKNESAVPRFFDEDDEKDDASEPKPVATDDANLKAVPIKSSLQCNLLEESFSDDAIKEELLSKSSSFSIDINPRLVLSSEELVETLITSGVGQYLEFTAIQHTYVHVQPEESKQQAVGSDNDTVWEVPCSKKDVFQSKLLGMVEKRQLMKFLQFVADYGETHIVGEDVGTKNERTLALGRALKRPQNKTNQADDDAIAKYLDRPFQELLEKHFKLSAKLQQVVVYCVGLASFPASKNQISGREGLAAVYRYVASIGRFTSTAFLVPLYGVSEIAQSFCRLCAVYGGIYVLRAPVDAFLLDEEANTVVGIRSNDGGMLRGKHVIINGSLVDSFKGETTVRTEKKTNTHGQILRGVFLLKSSLRVEMNRLMVVIPPEDSKFQNPFAIQVVQLDSSAYVCPRDYFLVQISMTLPADWIDDNDKQLKLVYAVMEQLVTSALAERKAKSKNGTKSESTEESAWSELVAWKAIYTMDHLASTNNTSSLAQKSSHLPANLWPCETRVDSGSEEAMPVNPLEIHLESASANARAIFNQLCPGEEFLPKSASAEQAEKEALEDEHDAVLQAAQKLAEQTNLNETQQEDGESTTRGDQEPASSSGEPEKQVAESIEAGETSVSESASSISPEAQA